MDDTGGVEKYKSIAKLSWNESERISGKIIKIRGFPRDKKIKLFWATISANRTEYIVTNDLSKSSTDDVEFESLSLMENRRVSRQNQAVNRNRIVSMSSGKNSKKHKSLLYVGLESFEKSS
ncbi:hypothetical protein CYANOKiyG1_35570 [Okeania sp. KiyG1]|nr:hypothetical protein CYANOKiyG1_35570 [Okeania sp. KiyG1]